MKMVIPMLQSCEKYKKDNVHEDLKIKYVNWYNHREHLNNIK